MLEEEYLAVVSRDFAAPKVIVFCRQEESLSNEVLNHYSHENFKSLQPFISNPYTTKGIPGIPVFQLLHGVVTQEKIYFVGKKFRFLYSFLNLSKAYFYMKTCLGREDFMCRLYCFLTTVHTFRHLNNKFISIPIVVI